MSRYNTVSKNRYNVQAKPVDQRTLMFIDRDNDFRSIANNLFKMKPKPDELWGMVAPISAALQDFQGVLYIKDMILERPNEKVTDTIYWQHSCEKKHNLKIKGANVMMAVVNYDKVNIPVAYKVLKREMPKLVAKTKQKSSGYPDKNKVFQELIEQVSTYQKVPYRYVVAESSIATCRNMELIKEDLKHDFIFAVTPHRANASNIHNQNYGRFQPLSTIDVSKEKGRLVFMDGIKRPLKAIRSIKTDPVGVTHEDYFITSDLELLPETVLKIFNKQQTIKQVAQPAYRHDKIGVSV